MANPKDMLVDVNHLKEMDVVDEDSENDGGVIAKELAYAGDGREEAEFCVEGNGDNGYMADDEATDTEGDEGECCLEDGYLADDEWSEEDEEQSGGEL